MTTPPPTGSAVPAQPVRPFSYHHGTLAADGLPLPDLAAAHGTPLFLYSAPQLRYRLSLFERNFAPTPHTVCYAVKSNSALAILQLLGRLGAGFDIVSGGELERVRRAHPPALERVVFSGVGKQPWEIDAALRSNILLFNVESPAELDLLAARALALGRRARFALRVNPDVFARTHPYISTGLREHKFGIDIALARDLYRHAAQHPSLQPAGVSVHIGSQIRSVTPFAQALERVADLVRDLRSDGHRITHIDAGGGLGIDYHAPVPGYPFALAPAAPDTHDDSTESQPESQLESQTTGDPTSASTPPSLTPEAQVASYAEALLPILASLATPGEPPPHLLLEPGRFLVAQAGGLLTRVLTTKQNGSKHFTITDAAMNDLIRPALYQAHHEILPVTLPTQPTQTTNPVISTEGEAVAGVPGEVSSLGWGAERPASPPAPNPVISTEGEAVAERPASPPATNPVISTEGEAVAERPASPATPNPVISTEGEAVAERPLYFASQLHSLPHSPTASSRPDPERVSRVEGEAERPASPANLPTIPNAVISTEGEAAAERPAFPPLQPVDVVGPVCESGDFFARDRPLPPIHPGDLLLLLDAGAYGMSQSSNYNTRPRAAELLLDGGEAHLIRRRETLDDLLQTEHLL